ncbi:MAG: serine hydrolase domain-containing protein [Acidobacteriota bacterium]
MLKRLLSKIALSALVASTTAASADVTTIVTNKIDNYKAHRAFTGAVVAVVDHGYYYYYWFGWKNATDEMTVTTPVAIASNTKTFVGTSLALADAYEGLPKETELHTLVPIAGFSPPYHATLEDLVSYWSGLPRDVQAAHQTRADLYNTLSECAFWGDPCFTPETQNLYSNYGFEVLGNVLADYAGFGKWSDMNAQDITGPLGMTKTCARGDGCHPNFSTSHAHAYDFWGNDVALPDYSDVSAPKGGLWSTAEDMAIWLRYQLGYIPSSTQELTRLNAVLPELRKKLPSGSGYSWQFSTLTFRDGSTAKVRWKLGRYMGLNSYIGLADAKGTAVFVFVNRDGSDPVLESPDIVLRDELGEPLLQMFP